MRLFVFMLSLLLSGCGGSEKNILLSTGKVPPTFFHFSSKKDMDNFVLDTTKYSILMPQTKLYDFSNGKKWDGGSSRDGNSIGLFNEKGYHIDITTDYKSREYTEMDRAVKRGDLEYLRKGFHKYHKDTKVKMSTFGKESYRCTIVASIERNSKYPTTYHTVYSCYKFDTKKQKVKKVSIHLSYSKPTNPTLAKHYTYTDLKRRAKRMLDSFANSNH